MKMANETRDQENSESIQTKNHKNEEKIFGKNMEVFKLEQSNNIEFIMFDRTEKKELNYLI